MRKNYSSKKNFNTPPPPPPNSNLTFFKYNNIPSISKLYSTPPSLGARTCKVSRKYSNAFLSYSAKTKRDGWTDGRTDIQTDGGRCNISRPRAYGAGRR